MAKSHVKDTDRGYKALRQRLTKAAAGARVSVGVHEAEGDQPAGDDGEATVLDVAVFNEFGTEHIPPRSFIGAWEDENVDEHKSQLRKIGQAVVKGAIPSVEVGLERFGLHAVGEVQQRIAAGIAPENAESTVERKGSSTPLINHGQLRSAIAHHVKSGTSE